MLTKAYGMVSTVALLIVVGVRPADLELLLGSIGLTSGRLDRPGLSNVSDPDGEWLFPQKLSELCPCEENGLEFLRVDPVHYMELLGSWVDFDKLKKFAHGWHRLRGGYK
ncbi:hypothetical protein EVAR_10620_1 [Eumeta japonica]|uniref:Uncharacterized protein n=1 Tax=Eumeta variegata TaxID=151549 RepID=A0A4C1U1X4_EUMVA|nr:hypothetical protein EVAR_10620_1 [Eumeta japonica]